MAKNELTIHLRAAEFAYNDEGKEVRLLHFHTEEVTLEEAKNIIAATDEKHGIHIQY